MQLQQSTRRWRKLPPSLPLPMPLPLLLRWLLYVLPHSGATSASARSAACLTGLGLQLQLCVRVAACLCLCVCVSFAPAACGTPNCSCRQLRLKFLINTKEKPLQVFHHHQVAPFFCVPAALHFQCWKLKQNTKWSLCLFWFIGTPQVSKDSNKHTCKLYSYVHTYVNVCMYMCKYICMCVCFFYYMWPTPVALVPYPRYVIQAIWP